MTSRDQDGGADPATAYRAHLTDALEAALAENDPRLYLVACSTLHRAGAGGRIEPRTEIATGAAGLMLDFYDTRLAGGEPREDAVMGAAYDTLRAALVAALSCQTLLGGGAFGEVWNHFVAELTEESEPVEPPH